MRFKVDENLPEEVAELLRLRGHDATTVLEQSLGGYADHHIAKVCQTERRTLITLDTDFSNVRVFPPNEFSGILVLRLRHQDKPSVLKQICPCCPFTHSREDTGLSLDSRGKSSQNPKLTQVILDQGRIG